MSTVKRHPLISFYCLAFAISWLGWGPVAAGSQGIRPFDSPYVQFLLILPAVGPGVAAIIVAGLLGGGQGVKRLLRPLLQWRVGLIWYAVAVLGPLVLLAAQQVVTELLGMAQESGSFAASLVPMTIAMFFQALLSNPWEEVGWRGFALPRLQGRYNAATATLIVGLLWGLWHLPIFFWAGNPMSQQPFLLFVIGTMAGAFVYTWLYNSTRGSLLIVTLYHIAGNTFVVWFGSRSPLIGMLVSVLVALVLVLLAGAQNLSRQPKVVAG